jgi:AraC-like ligand binding domain
MPKLVFIVPPGETHENYTKTGCYYRNFYFHPNLLRDTVEDLNGYEEFETLFTEPVLSDTRLIDVYLKAHRASATTIEHRHVLCRVVQP